MNIGRIASRLLVTLFATISVTGKGVAAHAQDCPPHLQAQIDRAGAVKHPSDFTAGMAALPETINTSDPALLSVTNNSSRIQQDPAFQSFRERYRTNPLNVNPVYSPAIKYHNSMAMLSHHSSQAAQTCKQIGLINKRLKEIMSERDEYLKQYLNDQWIDFTSNSLTTGGTVVLYFTGAAQAVQYGKASMQVKKLKDAAAANGVLYETALAAVEGKLEPLLALARHWEKFPSAFNAGFAGNLVSQEQMLAQLLAHAGKDSQFLLGLLTQAEAVAKRAGIGLTVTAGSQVARAGAGAVAGPCPAGTGCDLLTTVFLGGNVWKQFEGYKDPFDEMITTMLTQKKKFMQKFQASIASAESYKSSAEGAAVEVVRISNQPPPTGIGYGGFTISYPG